MNKISLVVFGKIPTKSNTYIIGKGRFITSNKVKKYVKKACQDLQPILASIRARYKLPITEDVIVHYVFEIGRPKDADNLEKTINDLLQQAGVIQNDQQIKHHTTQIIKTKQQKEKAIITIIWGGEDEPNK